jgi:excisionase family DNA binding protein
MQQELLTISDFCRSFVISRSKVYTEMAAGRLRAVKAGRRRLIRVEDAREWAANLPEARAA